MKEENNQEYVVGIDVSSKGLDVCIEGSKKVQHYENSITGIDKLIQELQKQRIKMVAFESTGSYTKLLKNKLYSAKIPLSEINPRRIKNYSRSLGYTAKTDNLDARIICDFAQKTSPRITKKPPEYVIKTAELFERKYQLNKMMVQEKNRFSAPGIAENIASGIKEHIELLATQIKKLDSEINKEINKDETALKLYNTLVSIDGVGPQLTYAVMGYIPEIGVLNRKQVAALVGVAPFNNDSGFHRGLRRISGGREKVRSILYMATVSSIQHSEILSAEFARFKKSGKHSMVALVACMRKLISYINSKAKEILYPADKDINVTATA